MGDYLREGGDYLLAIIERRLLFEEIWYLFCQNKNGSCEGIGPKGRVSPFKTLLSTPGKTHTIALPYP